jgi:hypothetical protein
MAMEEREKGEGGMKGRKEGRKEKNRKISAFVTTIPLRDEPTS